MSAATVREAAQDGVRDGVRDLAAGGMSRSGGARLVPLGVAAAVVAAACAPVVWPLLPVAAGAGAGALVVQAALAQVGGVSGGLLSEAATRAWDRVRRRGGQPGGLEEFRAALSQELTEALTASSTRAAACQAAALRAEVALVLREVGAVQVALAATVEESAARVRGALVDGLRALGSEFTEFGWVLEEVSRQLTEVAGALTRAEAAGRQMVDYQMRTRVELALLSQDIRSAITHAGAIPAPAPATAGPGEDEDAARAAALERAGVPVSDRCPYPGLAAFQPADFGMFFGRRHLTAVLVTRLAEQLARPGLLIVAGPSGSGKSSLLRAGLLPAIGAGQLPVRGSAAWPRDLMTPGRRPLLELATRVASLAGLSATALEDELRQDPARVAAVIRQGLIHDARRAGDAARRGAGPAPSPVVIDQPVVIDLAGAGRADPVSAGGSQHVVPAPRLVLIVDQFEEIFTQCPDEAERRAFVRALCAAAGALPDPRDGATQRTGTPPLPAAAVAGTQIAPARQAPGLVVIGMRADFYPRCLTYPELVPYLQDHQLLVGAMDEAEVREAITCPATEAGLVTGHALAEVLLADLGLRSTAQATRNAAAPGADDTATAASRPGSSYEAGRLPLLAHALWLTWQNREGRQLTLAGYRTTGGIDGAVALAAETVYGQLDTAGQDAARRLLLRLITLGEGAADTRRRVVLAELPGPAGSPDAAITQPVLTALVQARLLTTDTETVHSPGAGAGVTVEITHEVLLTAWPRLTEWLNHDRAGQRTHRALTETAHAWHTDHQDPSHLLRGTRLTLTNEWATRHERDLHPRERAFLAASGRHQRGATRRRRVLVAALAVLTAASAVTAGLAVRQRADALARRDEAISGQLLTEADRLRGQDISLAAQLTVVAHRLHPTPDSASRLLDTSVTPLSTVLTGHTGKVFSVAFSPDGRTLASASGDHTVRLWDTTDPARPVPRGQPLAGHTDNVEAVAFSPDGRTLASAGNDHTIRLWDTTNPARPVPRGQPLTGHTGKVFTVAFSPDGRTLASGGADHTVRLWDLTAPAGPPRLAGTLSAHNGDVESVAFNRDGHTLASGSLDDTIRLWDVADPAHPTLLGHPIVTGAGAVNSVGFSPDGRSLAGGGKDAWIRLWTVADPTHPVPMIGTGTDSEGLLAGVGGIQSVVFSPDGRTVAGGGVWDHAVRLWDFGDPAHPKPDGLPLDRPLTGHSDAVASLAFAPDGRSLASASLDGTIRLWNLRGSALSGHTAPISSLAFSPDRRTLASASQDAIIRLWNVADPAQPAPLGAPFAGTQAVFSPDGRLLASAGGSDRAIRLWSVADPAHPALLGRQLTGQFGPLGSLALGSLAFSPDGRTLASSDDKSIRLWNVTDPAHPTLPGQPLTGHTGAVMKVAFSPDGHTLASGSFDNTIRLWNVADPAHPARLGKPLTDHTGVVLSVAFSPDGHLLASGSFDNTIRLWNVADPAHPALLGKPLTGHTGAVYSVALSPDGRTLASGSFDDTLRLWNIADPADPTPLGGPLTTQYRGVGSLVFSPDGHTLASGRYTQIQLWDLNADHAIARVCAWTAGALTSEVWNRYLPHLPYDPPCHRA